MFRKSHLLPVSASKSDGNKQFPRSCFKFFPWGAVIVVKWSKTIQSRECIVHIPIPCIADPVLCPFIALLHSMSFTASRATANSHVFTYLDYDSLGMKCFTFRSFINKLRDSLQSLGLSPGLYAGHSFRRGGATHAFQAGVPVELIKILRDSKSGSVELYLTVPLQVRLMTANLVSKSVS